MALDVWIYGPGFGEAILLIWDEDRNGTGTERRAAFIDCYGGRDYESHPALCQWQDAGCPDVALVAVTHPHLDHIQHASIMMEAAGCTADTILWWGGQDLRRMRAFYDQLSEDNAMREQETGKAAAMTRGFLNDITALDDGKHRCRPAGPKPDIRTAMGIDLAYEEPTAAGLLRFHSISPWLGPQTPYTEWIDSQIYTTRTGGTVVCPRKGVANCTSLGFLIEYGGAQVLLGGDMEDDNWTHFNAARSGNGKHKDSLPSLRPCLIKVSHHGSSTGHVPEMWKPGCGFFGWRGATVDDRPLCVVTPWRRGNAERHLPDPDVVRMISRAGCHVWETASSPELAGIDRNSRPCGTYIYVSVDPLHNRATVLSENLCRHTPPQL